MPHLIVLHSGHLRHISNHSEKRPKGTPWLETDPGDTRLKIHRRGIAGQNPGNAEPVQRWPPIDRQQPQLSLGISSRTA